MSAFASPCSCVDTAPGLRRRLRRENQDWPKAANPASPVMLDELRRAKRLSGGLLGQGCNSRFGCEAGVILAGDSAPFVSLPGFDEHEEFPNWEKRYRGFRNLRVLTVLRYLRYLVIKYVILGPLITADPSCEQANLSTYEFLTRICVAIPSRAAAPLCRSEP